MDNARDFVASEGYSFKGREYVRLAHVLDAAIDSNLLSPAELGRLFDKVDSADMSCATWPDYFRLRFFITDHYRGSVPDISTDRDADARRRGFKIDGTETYLRQPPLGAIIGKFAGAGPNTSVEFSTEVDAPAFYALMPAECLQPSHINGRRNPRFFLYEAQPKDRRDVVSVAAAEMMASRLNPLRLFDRGDFGHCDAYSGAPIVNHRGEVIQGNGRAAALRIAFADHPASASLYTARLREWWRQNADRLGAATGDVPDGHVLVRVLYDKDSPDEFPDSAAIVLGQYTDHQVTTGGDTVFDARNVLRMMQGDHKLGFFVGVIMRNDNDEEDSDMSLMECIDANYEAAVAWLARHKYITPAEAEACKANGDAGKLQIKKVFERMLFAGGADNIETMAKSLPRKSQSALYAVAHRDLDMPDGKKLVPHLQRSIQAYYEVSASRLFKGRRTLDEALSDLANWARQGYLDSGGRVLYHGDEFSDFELYLVAMYKTMTATEIRRTLNDIYDRMAGTSAGDLFSPGSDAPVPLAEAVKAVTGAALGEVDIPKPVSRDPSDDPDEHDSLLARIAELLSTRFDRRDKPHVNLTKLRRVEDCAARFNSSAVPAIGDYTNADLGIILSALSHYAAFKDGLPKLLSPFTR